MRLIDADYLTTEIARLVVGGKHAIEEAGHGNFWINGLHDVQKIIDNAPTAPQVTVFAENASKEEIEDFKQELEKVLERPQGKWVEKQETPTSISYYCSNCEHIGLGFENFCAWCGAKMKIKNISPDSGIREFDKKFADLIVFNDQPQRQLKSSDVHEDV